MTNRLINPDALIATFDAHDDEWGGEDIRIELIVLLSQHLAELGEDDHAFLLSYDICPQHHCDIEICIDDKAECQE